MSMTGGVGLQELNGVPDLKWTPLLSRFSARDINAVTMF